MGIQVRLSRELNPSAAGRVQYQNTALSEEVKSALWLSTSVVTDDTSRVHCSMSIGMTNGSATTDPAEQQCAGTWREDDTLAGNHRGQNFPHEAAKAPGRVSGTIFTAVLNQFLNTGTRGAELDHTVVASDGGTVATALFAGSDLSVAQGLFSQGSGTNVRESTGLSNIDLLIFFSTAATGGVRASSSSLGLEVGACARRSATSLEQASLFIANAAITSGSLFFPTGYVATDRAWTQQDDSRVDTQMEITSISGGDFTWSGVSATSLWWAFDFGGRAQASVKIFTNDTASARTSVAVGFQPFFAFIGQTLLRATDTLVTTAEAGSLSLGLVDMEKQYAFAISWEEGDGVSLRDNCHSYMDEVAIASPLPDGTFGSGALKATASFGTRSVDLDFSVNSSAARHGLLIAIGPSRSRTDPDPRTP